MAVIVGTNGPDTIYGADGEDDEITGLGGNDWIQSGDGNDTIDGGQGADALWSGPGDDTMTGGTGGDTYHVDSIGDLIIENVDEGIDRVHSYYIGVYDMLAWAPNVENIRLVGFDTGLNAAGNDLDNTMEGNRELNTLTGGNGDDVFIVHDTTDVVDGEAGSDTVYVDFTANLSTTSTWSVENITLGGHAAINATGDAQDNTLTGNDAKNTLTGGLGNDTYVVQSLTDVIKENAGEGTDTVETDISYSIAGQPNLENITLTGTAAVNATGNAGVNILIGNDAGNSLDGGLGADTMTGGLGNDTYVVSEIGDVLNEDPGEGTDTVRSIITWTLADEFENLTLLAAGPIDGAGNAANNTIIGSTGINSLDGGAGNDWLDGGSNADTMSGGLGDDIYIVDNANDYVDESAGDGLDTVRATIASGTVFTMHDGVEVLQLLGTTSGNVVAGIDNNTITGNTGANALSGGDGNDTITGGGGLDTLRGDGGDDTLVGGSAIDKIYGGDGDDSVDAGSGKDTIDGGDGNDVLHGYNDDDLMYGGDGSDHVDGGGGKDIMYGGIGDDSYGYDNYGDNIIDYAGEGHDIVLSFLDLVLWEESASREIEDISIDPVTPEGVHGTATYATGNSQNNGVYGNLIDNVLSGAGGNDSIFGNTGNDTLDGGSGFDLLYGEEGNDTYIIDDGDIVNENVGEGTDIVMSSISYTLTSNVENLTLTGSGNINGTGNALVNTITGNSGINILSGGDESDIFVVGAGDDVVELAGQGTLDTVMSNITWVLASNGDTLHEVEGLTLTGSSAINGTGNELDNRISGNSALNTLAGGLGDDTFVVDDVSDLLDVLVENAGEGNDTVEASISYTLQASTPTLEIENIHLVGASNIDATGNDLDNTLTGNDANNTLDGSTGADTMIGGLGDDAYVVDNIGDVVTEAAGEGIDSIFSSITFDMGSDATEVENLTLTGSAIIEGTGNALDNIITGNDSVNTLAGGDGADTLYGGAGDDVLTAGVTGDGTDADTLDGGAGTDTMTGSAGNDLYIADSINDVIVELAAEGTDTVQATIGAGETFVLAAEVENLILFGNLGSNGTGNAGNNVITGDGGINTLTGLDGNDTLDGGAAGDTLIGGLGNDTYVVDSAFDTLIELPGEGTDTVKSYINYTLLDEFENLTLLGTVAVSGTGNSVVNVVMGNSIGNSLDGAAGADTMIGLGGNDTYAVDDALDVVDETGGTGTDLILASVDYDMSTQTIGLVDNMTLIGAALVGTGNTFANVITGNAGINTLDGGGGDDTLIGGTGADTMTGGAGNDTFYVDDALDVVIDADVPGETLDTVFSGVSYTLGAGQAIEIFTLTGSAAINGTGNEFDNTITGNLGVNTLSGMDGDDTLAGGANDVLIGGNGSDTAMVGFTSDLVTLNAGPMWEEIENILLTGTLKLNAYGDSGVNVLTGNDAANILDGRAGADTMAGGFGDDTYYVDDVGDFLDETGGGGKDVVFAYADCNLSYIEAQGIEDLYLLGTALVGIGNNSTNYIKGNDLDNTLIGGLGADTMDGGKGNDTYGIDNLSDLIKDGGGVDTVVSTLSNYTLANKLENLTLGGMLDINGTGNNVANIIIGNTGDNVLDGGKGADTMYGGLGDDIFIVDNAKDVVHGEGNGFYNVGDLVKSSVTYSIAPYTDVENLELTGKKAINGTGNILDNTITGNAGKNILNGGDGNDTLIGGGGGDILIGGDGDDTFYFDFVDYSSKKTAVIQDFDFDHDSILYGAAIDPLLHVNEDFIEFKQVGSNVQVFLDFDGPGSDFGSKLIATLLNVTLPP